MAYGHIMDFMYEVGIAIGEFQDDEELVSADVLANIVRDYVQKYYWLDIVLLRKQIKGYLAKYASDGAVDHYDPPFNQELCFVDYRFGCELYDFLLKVLALLDVEIGRKRNRIVDYLIGGVFCFMIRKGRRNSIGR